MGKYLTYGDRLRIESWQKEHYSVSEIAHLLGKHISCIYRELKRGQCVQLKTDLTSHSVYSADLAQKKAAYNATAKGTALKVGNDYEFVNYVGKMLKSGYSPDAIFLQIKKEGLKFKTNVCTKTIYNYIDAGLFLGVTRQDLVRKGKQKTKRNKVVRTSVKNVDYPRIHDRPLDVNERLSFGHWEMDTVLGKRAKKPCLLVLTERLTRHEIIIKIKEKTQASVKRALDRLERSMPNFNKIFKSFTVDNGSEFSFDSITQSCKDNISRTQVWFCHPYSSWERGSNENQNAFIRRFIPKGSDISRYTQKQIKQIENFINNYPRRLLGGLSSLDLFNIHINDIT